MNRLSMAALVALVALSSATYHPALEGQFVSDDLNAIVGNEFVTAGSGPVAIFTNYAWWGNSRADAPGYRPLATWSFALNHRAVGSNVAWWHAINFILHGLVCWLVFLLALELGLRRSTAGWSGILFCVLSIHTEAVAWVVGRAELLAAIGYCGALLAYLRYRNGAAQPYATAGALFLCLGTFAKENAATAIAAPLIGMVCLPAAAGGKKRDIAMFFALFVGFCGYAVTRVFAEGSFWAGSAGDLLDNPLAVAPVVTRWLGAVSVLGRYLALTVWPYPLSVDYSFDALAIGSGFIADRYSFFAMIALVTFGVAAWRGSAALRFSLLLTGSSYALVSNTVLVIGTVMAERLFYVPTIGLVLAAASALDAPLGRKRISAAVTGILTLVCTAYGAVSMNRCYDWLDSIRLFESAVAAQPRSARAHMELASAYGRAGRAPDAEKAFAQATEILPSYAAAWYNLGNARARSGALDDAAAAYNSAVAHSPRLVQAWYNLGLVEQMRGRPSAAITAFSEASEISPGDVEARFALADALTAAGRFKEALAVYEQTIEISGPRRGVAVAGAIACLSRLGRHDEAGRLAQREKNRQIANPASGR